MKILVTGVTGFIGKYLIQNLLNRGYIIVALIRPDSDVSIVDKRVEIQYYTGDIELLLELFCTKNFDGIIHLASLFVVSHQSKDIPSLIGSNIQFGTELLEACKIAKTKWFINTGTFWQHYHNEVYSPVNLYAATKQAFEEIAKYYTETSDLVFTSLVLNDTFGPNDTRNKIFNLWNKLSKSKEKLVMSRGEQIIDISYIEDVISAYETMIEHLIHHPQTVRNKTFAVRSDERMSLKDLAGVFEEAIGMKLNIEWGGREYRDREVMIPWEDGLILPGWKPKYTLKDAIQKTLGVYK